MIQHREGAANWSSAAAAGRRGRGLLIPSGQRRHFTATTVSSPVAVETASPPVDGGVVDDGGQDGVFVCKGGGKGSWFVSMGDVEDQALVAAVVVVVDLVPVVLQADTEQEKPFTTLLTFNWRYPLMYIIFSIM